MILHTHSDSSCLPLHNSRSCAGGYFFFSNEHAEPAKARVNVPIHVLCTILKNIMASVVETEIAAAFVKAQKFMHVRPPWIF